MTLEWKITLGELITALLTVLGWLILLWITLHHIRRDRQNELRIEIYRRLEGMFRKWGGEVGNCVALVEGLSLEMKETLPVKLWADLPKSWYRYISNVESSQYEYYMLSESYKYLLDPLSPMRDTIEEEIHEFSVKWRSFIFDVVIPFRNEDGTPDRTKVEEFEAKWPEMREKVFAVGEYLLDLEREIQNLLMGPIFKKEAPRRNLCEVPEFRFVLQKDGQLLKGKKKVQSS